MTPNEARQILTQNGYCERHGTKKQYSVQPIWGMGYTPKNLYCPDCKKMIEESNESRVEEAKKVLGL